MLNEYFLNLNLSLYAYDVHFCHLPGMHCPDEGLAAAAARVENGWSPGMRGDRGCGIGGGQAVGRSLMEALCRVMAAQHRHATAAGVRVSLAVPDSRRM